MTGSGLVVECVAVSGVAAGLVDDMLATGGDAAVDGIRDDERRG